MSKRMRKFFSNIGGRANFTRMSPTEKCEWQFIDFPTSTVAKP